MPIIITSSDEPKLKLEPDMPHNNYRTSWPEMNESVKTAALKTTLLKPISN